MPSTISGSDGVTASNYNLSLTTAGSDSINLDFLLGNALITRSAAGNIIFTGSNYTAGVIRTVRIVCDASTRNLTFPTNWVFLGAKPASITASKTGVLSVTCYGTTEASCVASWAVQT